MEDHLEARKQSSSEELPSVRKHMTSGAVTGSDSIADDSDLSCQVPSTTVRSPRGDPTLGKGSGTTEKDYEMNVIGAPSAKATALMHEPRIPHSFFISMPASPSGLHIEQIKKVMFTENAEKDGINGHPSHPINYTSVNIEEPKDGKLHSQPVQIGNSHGKVGVDGVAHRVEIQQPVPRSDSVRDKRFDSFKTLSGRFERQLSNLRGKPREPDLGAEGLQSSGSDSIPEVDRYFAALEGPELDTLRPSEELALPEDQLWPFLLRFPVSSFGMCLGVSSQAMLWKTLATAPSMRFLHVSLTVNLVLWCISLVLMGIVSLTYTLKIIFYFETVRREYYHPIRVNFFFAPWIACLFLASGVPPSVAENRPAALWYVLMAPIFCLELKIYGQWMSGGKRRLSKVANPSNHLSIVGNFVGALLGASMGLKEGPIFFFAVGLAHYIVLFVTLYQRLPTNETLPKDLHPVFFLFVAAPSVACMAWAKICGEFAYGSKIAYFVAMFLYASLAVRINFFRGFRFSLAWWAYTFPMTGASIATIRYTDVVNNVLTRSLSVTLSSVATFTVTALLVTTIFHAFVLHKLFPNDVSIAITRKRLKLGKGRKPLKSVSLDSEPRKSMNLDIEDNELSISIDPRSIPLTS